MNYESLWANIHKKRERIKRGSGERMRKKGEKGAPTPAQLKRAKGESVTEEMKCPPATQNLKINTANRDATIKNFNYGPLNVDEPGDYWKDIAKYWKTTEEAAKKSVCNNCVAFDVSPRMLDCMPGETSDDDGRLGYCWMHHFKCHSARACHTWAKGGPIKTDEKSYDWQKRAKMDEEMTSTSSVAGAGDNPEKIVPVHMKKRKKDRENIIRRFIENRKKSENLMRERVLAKYEASRIPRKKGQPAGSDKHSDLYTDENPKGTIHGLGFKDVETAKASVNKIESSSRTHAHKIQAAIAMEQRARVMGKTAEANVYRAYIEKMKKITKQKKNK